MDDESKSLTKLREEARRRRQHTVALGSTYEATMPQIKMIVSNWYTDELGNQARIIRAHDWELQRNTTGAFVFETERGGSVHGGRRQPPRENHWRARQAAVRGPCSHAAPRLRLCLGQCGS